MRSVTFASVEDSAGNVKGSIHASLMKTKNHKFIKRSMTEKFKNIALQHTERIETIPTIACIATNWAYGRSSALTVLKMKLSARNAQLDILSITTPSRWPRNVWNAIRL